MKLKDWLRLVRKEPETKETYVDGSELHAEPEGPYRARLQQATHHTTPEGIDVLEREIVKGQLQLLFRTRCPCGHEWDSHEFHRVTLCPKCGRPVLVEVPQLPGE